MSLNEQDPTRYLAAARGVEPICPGAAPERLVVQILEAARPAYWLALAATVLVVGFAVIGGAL